MYQTLFWSLCTLALSVSVRAQTTLTTFGGGADRIDARESTWIAYFDQSSQRFTGGFALNYNKVQWQDEYAEQLDTILRGKRWRLGKHFWSTLDTNLTLEIGGTLVEPGYYYLGLGRSEDGAKWKLLLIDAAAARDQRLDAFNIDRAPIAHEVPMRFASSPSSVGFRSFTSKAR